MLQIIKKANRNTNLAEPSWRNIEVEEALHWYGNETCRLSDPSATTSKLLLYFLFSQFALCSFICQVASTRRQQIRPLRSWPPVTASLTTQDNGNAIKYLAKDITSELASLSTYYPFLMLNVKQESLEY